MAPLSGKSSPAADDDTTREALAEAVLILVRAMLNITVKCRMQLRPEAGLVRMASMHIALKLRQLGSQALDFGNCFAGFG